MKEDPNMDAYSGQERIDELLNGYVDNELGTRQRTEVERLIANDEQIKRRLRQLQKCRALLGSMPCAEVPPQVLKGVQASLASAARLHDQSSYNQRAGRIHLLARKALSAAAMLGLAALLGAVIYTILAPQPSIDGPPGYIPGSTISPALAFSGRLELTTSKLQEVGTVVNAAIKENGLSDSVDDISQPNRRIHYLRCSRQGLNSLLASLEPVWSKLDSATMVINTEVFDDQVSIDAVTTWQIAEIIDQESRDARIKLAKDFDMLNSLTEDMPGKTLRAAIDGESPSFPIIPKPIITSDAKSTLVVPEADKTICLTIILSR
ncbi:MAG: hypothetical protein JSW47_10220 [Phycisphaerales bacterium]|nr:MAG: hypothetical protein JSW47_10220 [Phycisphaerales bacterium]